jgi:hypothetical protein
LFVNGKKVAEGRIEHTQCCSFSADEGTDVGEDNETNVTNDYKEGDNKFTGDIAKVTISTNPADLSTKDKEELEKEAAVEADSKE